MSYTKQDEAFFAGYKQGYLVAIENIRTELMVGNTNWTEHQLEVFEILNKQKETMEKVKLPKEGD